MDTWLVIQNDNLQGASRGAPTSTGEIQDETRLVQDMNGGRYQQLSFLFPCPSLVTNILWDVAYMSVIVIYR